MGNINNVLNDYILTNEEREMLDILLEHKDEIYIDDVIIEVAESKVPPYRDDRTEWVKSNTYATNYMEMVVDECLIDWHNYSLFNHIGIAMSEQIKVDLFGSLTNRVFEAYILTRAKEKGIEEVTDEQMNMVISVADDKPQRMDILENTINDIFNIEQ